MKTSLFVLAFICSNLHASAQLKTDTATLHRPAHEFRYAADRYISLLAAFNYWQYGFAEIGVAIHQDRIDIFEPATLAYFVSSEIKIDKKTIIGPKVGCWAGGGAAGVAMGLNLIYYTDNNSSSLRFRPEIGFGFDNFKFVYGYNIALSNKAFAGINTNNVTLVFLLNLKKTNEVRIKKKLQ